MKRLLLAAALLAVSPACALSASARATTPAAVPAKAPEQVIEIKNFMFMTVTVAKGTKVTWINRDQVPHTVIEKNRLFHSAALDTDDAYSYVFDTPGTYQYFCSLHPQTVAQIVVTDAPAPMAKKIAHKHPA